MKVFKKLSVLILALIMVVSIVACKPSTPSGGGKPQTNKTLTPKDITHLKDITNYGQKQEHLKGNTVTYGDTEKEDAKAKLTVRINEKKEDVESGKDVSSIVKIFAASDAGGIVGAMQNANLPTDKMQETVNYMAGAQSVTTEEIAALVDGGTFDKTKTQGWSFFDDWDYYDKLKNRADETQADADSDNVKRQYRNMMGKIFAIGMSGDQFARLAVHELVYATTVVEKMAEDSGIVNARLTISATLGELDEYCRKELDYETLVYLRAFNEYYNLDGSNNGRENCVELYGYYYEYNKTDYYSQTDEEFEKQLTYGHKTIFTDVEWLDYVKLQRDSYIKAYRYSDSFYQTFYEKHFAFQSKVEKHEEIVYNISPWNNKSYTGEMQQAIRDNGLVGQLNFTDWVWCYAGNDTVMKEYNAANTANENGKKANASAEQKYDGQFQYDMAQLKFIEYILHKDHMGDTNLGRTLRFQVYSYSGEMIKSAQGYNKDIALVNADKIKPDEATKIISGLNESDQRDYAMGKLNAVLGQMNAAYSHANVSSAANNASNQPWRSMYTEVKNAIDKDYSGYSKAKEKVEALEDMVIKKKWDCGGTDEECGKPANKNRGHVGCEKKYDETHNISKFVSAYESILRHMGGSANIKFQNDALATDKEKNNYAVKEYPSGASVTYVSGFQGSSFTGKRITAAIAAVSRITVKEISVSSGKTFTDGIKNVGGDDLKWWESATPGHENRVATKAKSEGVTENFDGNHSSTFTYTYTFTGWYLDTGLQYLFDPDDKIACDLTLYAGYTVEKKG